MNNNETKPRRPIRQKQDIKALTTLTEIVLMRLLAINYHYTFIVHRSDKIIAKSLQHFPIEKIYNPQNELLFDSKSINIQNPQVKEMYCRKTSIETMISEMQSLGYDIKRKQQLSTVNKVHINESSSYIELENIIRNDGEKLNFSACTQSIGQDGYDLFKNFFESNPTIDTVVYGNKDYVIKFSGKLTKRGITKYESSVFVGEGYDTLVEEVYIKKHPINILSNEQK